MQSTKPFYDLINMIKDDDVDYSTYAIKKKTGVLQMF